MFRIERTSYGLKLTVEGSIEKEETLGFLDEYREKLAGIQRDIALLIDGSKARPLSPEALYFLATAYREGRLHGVKKLVFILKSAGLQEQIQRTFMKEGAAGELRFIDAQLPNSDRIALDWIEKGIEP
jgi:hypothetical protein